MNIEEIIACFPADDNVATYMLAGCVGLPKIEPLIHRYYSLTFGKNGMKGHELGRRK
ncbi:MAG: hypothetical protein RL734_645 [Bacteroidota bacterium]|jgi:hypothetical protein